MGIDPVVLLRMHKELKSMREDINEIKRSLTNDKPILNMNEVSAYTGISKSRLYRLTSTGKIPFRKPKGRRNVYFIRDEIDKWLIGEDK